MSANVKRLTESQKMAVKTLDKNILVSASAGSGKTSTMVERTIHTILNQHINITEILALTFTENSAQDMKRKIADALKQNANDEFIRQQLDEINMSDISTFHAFCAKTIRQYFYIVNIDPNFAILDEVEAKFIKKEILEQTIEELETDKKLIDAISNLVGGRNLKKIIEHVLRANNFLDSIDNPDDFLQKRAFSGFERQLKNNEAFKFLLQEFNICILEHKEKFLKILEKTQNFAQIFEKIALLSDFFANFPVKSIDIFKKCNFDIKLPNAKKNMCEEEKALLSNINEWVDDLEEDIAKYAKVFLNGNESDVIKRLDNSRDLVQYFVLLLQKFRDNYSKFKNDMSKCDFADLEYYMAKVLENDEARKSIEEKYKYIDIDEYQDTNPRQESIINAIKENSVMFYVGDPKQSIYGFRHCEPAIMIDKFEQFQNDSGAEVIKFNKNFRSNAQILDFINTVFGEIMTTRTCGINYKDTSIFELDASGEDEKARVEIHIIDKQSVAVEYVLPPVYSVMHDENKALEDNFKEEDAIVKYIVDFISSDKMVMDKATKIMREPSFKDFAILTSTHLQGRRLIDKLHEHGLPVNAQSEENLLEILLVQKIHNFLKILNNPFEDIPLASTLKFVGGLNNGDLLEIKNTTNKCKFYYEYVFNYAGENEALKKKLLNFSEKIEKYRKKIAFFGIFDTIKLFLLEFKVEIDTLRFPNGSAEYQAVEMYLNLIKNSKFNFNLSDYLAWVENDKSALMFKMKTQESEDAIQIMTIHGSKGLEFPIVIVAGCGDNIKYSSEADINYSLDFGIGVKCFNEENRIKESTLITSANNFLAIKNERQEKLRVLYVALTRAEQYLAMFGELSLKKLYDEKLQFKKISNFFECILPPLNIDFQENILKYNKDNVNLFLHNIDDEFLRVNNSKLKLSHTSTQDELKLVGDWFDYKYAYENDLNIKVKNSVSRLMEEVDDVNLMRQQFKFLNKQIHENVLMDASLRGTAYHKAMECIDWGKSFDRQNFDEMSLEQQNMVNFVDIEKCYSKIKPLIEEGDKLLKEQKFMLYIPYSEAIENSNVNEKVLVQGVMDFVIEKADKVILIDYKTNNLTIEQFKEKYALQLTLYAKNFKKPVQKLLYSFKLNELIEVK